MKFNDKSQQYMLSLFKQYKPLSREEEQELFKKLPNKQARDKIINSNLMFVLKIVHQYKGYNVEFIDTVQEGIIGLTIAVEKFDINRGFKFITYAIWWTKSCIIRYIERNISLVKMTTTMNYRKLFWRLRATIATLDRLTRSESMAEAAKILNVPVSDVECMSTHLFNNDISLENRNIFCDGEGRSLADIIPSNDLPVDEQVIRQDINDRVDEIARSTLKARGHYVLYQTIIEERTLDAVGRDLNISRERTRQIQTDNINKLGKALRLSSIG